MAETAVRLCESSDAEIFRRDGDRLLLVAHHGPIPSRTLAVPLVRGTFNGRTVLDGRTFHVADLQSETDEFPCDSGSRAGRRPSLGGYVTGTGATRGCPPPEGVDVAYPLSFIFRQRLVISSLLLREAAFNSRNAGRSGQKEPQ